MLKINNTIYKNFRTYRLNLDILFISIIGFTAIPYIFYNIFTPSLVTGIRSIFGAFYMFSLFKLVNFKSKKIYGKWIIVLLLLVNTYIIFRANWNIQLKDIIQKNIFSISGVMYYTLPLLIFIPKNKIFLKKLFQYFVLWLSLGFLGYLLNINTMFIERDTIETTFAYSGMAVSLLLLFYLRYVTLRTKVFVYIIFFIFLITAIYVGRRNLIITGLEYMAMFMMAEFIYRKRKFDVVLFIVFLLPVLYLLTLQTDITKNLRNRGTEDNRTGVEEYFLNDFLNDPNSIIWGRGLNGTYNQPYFNQNDVTLEDRPGIETGYLNMVLKGGLIQTFLIIFLLILAITKGFMQKHKFIYGFSFFLLPLIIDNYTSASISQWTAKCVIMWFCIGLCLEKNISYKKMNTPGTPRNSRK